MQSRPNDNIIFEDSNSAPVKEPSNESTLPPFPKLLFELRSGLNMRPEEFNSLMFDDGPGYVYDKPETPFEDPKETDNNPFEGYFYDRPQNPMILPSPSTTTTTTTTTEEAMDIDLPDGAARILKRRR